ncbi:MAG TPA: hypothetical protein VFN75_00570 [Pseudonocardiaceae bacterium]|nr:hypothetical protein [Pseudonocardiaceae bacterium]
MHPIGYYRLRYPVMNTIAKLSGSVAGMADRDAVASSPSGGVESDGWAEDLLRRAGLPVSRPRRLVLEALRGGTGR